MEVTLIDVRRMESFLSKACHDRHNSTVLLLLRYEADISLCLENGASPFYIACQTFTQLLLKNRADINFCIKNGVCPLYLVVLMDMIALYNFYGRM